MEKRFAQQPNHFSHAYILPVSGEEGQTQARELAAAILCEDTERVPCGHCEHCRKVREQIHPDVLCLQREWKDGRQKKNITVDQIRSVIADAYILPNEAQKKVYIIEDADAMNPQAQNAILKILEEPPKFVVFLLLAGNPDLLLPTVRSRCITIRENLEDSPLTEEEQEMAKEFLHHAMRNNEAETFRWCMEHNTMNVQEMSRFMDTVRTMLVTTLSDRNLKLDHKKRMMHLIRLTDQCREYLSVNTGPKHVMAYLAVNCIPDRKGTP